MDNDGDVDVLVTTVNDVPLLLRNDGVEGRGGAGSGGAGPPGPPGPLSLLVATEGVRSNRNGIGARVTVVTDAVRQSRRFEAVTAIWRPMTSGPTSDSAPTPGPTRSSWTGPAARETSQPG